MSSPTTATSPAASLASSATASATPTAACGASLYQIPVPSQPACAMPYSSSNVDLLTSCCGDSAGADVVSYLDDCGLYCLAVDQTVGDLTNCLFDGGAGWADVFCQGNTTASATVTGGEQATQSAPAGASVSVVHQAGGDNDSGSDDSGDGDSDSNSSGDSDQTGGNGAATLGVSKVGVAIGALLFSATAFGALAL